MAVAIEAALSRGKPTPGPAHGANPFSLARPAEVESILGAAGFSVFGFEDVHEPVFYGPDAESAYQIVCSMSTTRDVLSRLNTSEARSARSRLRRLLARHETSPGVVFDLRAWPVTAKRVDRRAPACGPCRW